MIIGNFQVQHVLRSYSRQLADGSRVPKGKVDKRTAQRDEVTLSPEGKKRILAERVAKEILSQFSNGSELNQVGRDVLDRLSREYGRSLQLSFNEDQGMYFIISDETGTQGNKVLSETENEHLRNRLFDIIQTTVYNDLL